VQLAADMIAVALKLDGSSTDIRYLERLKSLILAAAETEAVRRPEGSHPLHFLQLHFIVRFRPVNLPRFSLVR